MTDDVYYRTPDAACCPRCSNELGEKLVGPEDETVVFTCAACGFTSVALVSMRDTVVNSFEVVVNRRELGLN